MGHFLHHMSLENANWHVTVFFLLALAIMALGMKLVVYFLPATVPLNRPLLFWILPSPASLPRVQSVTGPGRVMLRFALLIAALVVGYEIYWWLVESFQLHGAALSYLAVPLLILMTEAFCGVISLSWLPAGKALPPLHHQPWRARSVGDFWGYRWNFLYSDWTRHVIFQRLRRRPYSAVVLAFAVSGLLHEWVVNVPLYVVTGHNLLGTMMLYYLLQAEGIAVERRFKGKPGWSGAWAWLVVVGPVPLMINEGLLRVLHLWPG